MENTTTKIPVMIYTESTPNPNTLKFITNKGILVNDTAEFLNKEEAKEAPLAEALFDFNGVTNVFISNNYISVSKSDEFLWTEIMIPIKDFIKHYIEAGKTIITDKYVKPTRNATNNIGDDDTDVEIRIKKVLDKYVKPAVEMDGGNISFVRFEEGKLTLQLQGSCSGCPSSMVTLKQGIENIMKRFVPDVTEVVAEN
ncbi:MAG: NifU family protein [Bacteroidetes bacterium]|nr:NifU family protein [Bacteroidota bacterium]